MATPNLNITLPVVNGSTGAWGGILNTGITAIDAVFSATGTAVAINHIGKTVNATADYFNFKDLTTSTKVARFDLSGISASTTRVYTLPNVSDTLVSLTASQTLTNKTLTSPSLGGTITGTPTFGVNTTFSEDIYMRKTSDPALQMTNAAGNIGYQFLSDVDVSSNNGLKIQRYTGLSPAWETAATIASDSGVVLGSATGGSQGLGTINATNVFVNGVSLSPASGNAVARAWVRFTLSGTTVTVQNSFNISGVTRTSAGVYTVTFTTPRSNANYVTVANGPSVSNGTSRCFVTVTAQTVNNLTITMAAAAGGGNDDATAVNVLVFGS